MADQEQGFPAPNPPPVPAQAGQQAQQQQQDHVASQVPTDQEQQLVHFNLVLF